MKRSIIVLAVMIGISTATIEALAQRFVRDTSTSGEPAVEDTAAGLTWQGCAVGLTGNQCESGSAAQYNWQEALAYCEALAWGGHDDWRLPNRAELMSITDDRRTSPAIDTTTFPATPSSYFWSSSSYASSTSYAWLVNFDYGNVVNVDKSYTFYVRCVRGGP
jgi:hypothetical protein